MDVTDGAGIEIAVVDPAVGYALAGAHAIPIHP